MPAESFGVLVPEATWPEVQRLMCASGGFTGAENTKPNAHKVLVALIRATCKRQLTAEAAEPQPPAGIE